MERLQAENGGAATATASAAAVSSEEVANKVGAGPAAAAAVKCCACGQDKPPLTSFSRKMLTKPAAKRKCSECVAATGAKPNEAFELSWGGGRVNLAAKPAADAVLTEPKKRKECRALEQASPKLPQQAAEAPAQPTATPLNRKQRRAAEQALKESGGSAVAPSPAPAPAPAPARAPAPAPARARAPAPAPAAAPDTATPLKRKQRCALVQAATQKQPSNVTAGGSIVASTAAAPSPAIVKKSDGSYDWLTLCRNALMETGSILTIPYRSSSLSLLW